MAQDQYPFRWLGTRWSRWFILGLGIVVVLRVVGRGLVERFLPECVCLIFFRWELFVSIYGVLWIALYLIYPRYFDK